MVNVQQVKVELKRKGWSYRSAAPVLGTSYSFLARVLNGHQKSARLLAAIHNLPTLTEWSKAHDNTH